MAMLASAHPASAEMEIDIQPNGSAVFVSVDEEAAERRRLWTVSCRLPMRSCIARSEAAVLTIGRDDDLHLALFSGDGDRISLMVRNYTLDRPTLLAEPLSAQDLEAMDDPSAEIVIEANGTIIERVSVDGIVTTAQYLRWLNRAADEGTRDAAAFLEEHDPYRPTMDAAPALSHFQDAETMTSQPRWQLIPATKPQIEFAIRAQGGSSFMVDE